jgi:hypothetical protein
MSAVLAERFERGGEDAKRPLLRNVPRLRSCALIFRQHSLEFRLFSEPRCGHQMHAAEDIKALNEHGEEYIKALSELQQKKADEQRKQKADADFGPKLFAGSFAIVAAITLVAVVALFACGVIG